MYEEPKITILFLMHKDIINESPNGGDSGGNPGTWEDGDVDNEGGWV